MALPQAALDTLEYKDPQYIKGLGELAKNAIPEKTPSMLRPFLDVANNKNYLGIPIESEGMKYQYPTERKREYTSKIAIALSKGMDKIGIPKDKLYSPIQIDYILDSMTGGISKQFEITGEELADYPVIGDLILRDPYYPKRQVNNFFNDYEVLGQKVSSDIATPIEITKYNKLKYFRKLYTTFSKQIASAEKSKDKKKKLEVYEQMKKALASIGYK